MDDWQVLSKDQRRRIELKHQKYELAHQATVTFGQLSPIGKTKSRKGVLTILRPSSSSGSTVQTLRLLFFHGEEDHETLALELTHLVLYTILSPVYHSLSVSQDAAITVYGINFEEESDASTAVEILSRKIAASPGPSQLRLLSWDIVEQLQKDLASANKQKHHAVIEEPKPIPKLVFEAPAASSRRGFGESSSASSSSSSSSPATSSSANGSSRQGRAVSPASLRKQPVSNQSTILGGAGRDNSPNSPLRIGSLPNVSSTASSPNVMQDCSPGREVINIAEIRRCRSESSLSDYYLPTPHPNRTTLPNLGMGTAQSGLLQPPQVGRPRANTLPTPPQLQANLSGGHPTGQGLVVSGGGRQRGSGMMSPAGVPRKNAVSDLLEKSVPKTDKAKMLSSTLFRGALQATSIRSQLVLKVSKAGVISIRGGPIPKLIQYLVEENTDTLFLESFLLVYRRHTTSDAVFDQILSLMPTGSISEATLPLQYRTISILKTWLTCHPEDFGATSTIRQKLTRVADSKASSVHEEIGAILRGGSDADLLFGNAVTSASGSSSPTGSASSAGSSSRPQSPNPHSTPPLPAHNSSASVSVSVSGSVHASHRRRGSVPQNSGSVNVTVSGSSNSALLDALEKKDGKGGSHLSGSRSLSSAHPRPTALSFDAKDFAEQLCISEFEILCAWKRTDVLDMRDGSAEKNPPPIAVKNLIDRFNRVSMWVAHEICAEQNLKKRVQLLKHFIKIASHCSKLNNFNSLMELMAGLRLNPVQKLQKTWKSLSSKRLKEFQELQLLMSINYKNYRDTLKRAARPALPYCGVFVRDATVVNAVNSDHLDSSNAKLKLMNMEKAQMLCAIAREIVYFQEVKYNILPEESAQYFLRNLQKVDEAQIRELALKCEPVEK